MYMFLLELTYFKGLLTQGAKRTEHFFKINRSIRIYQRAKEERKLRGYDCLREKSFGK